MYKSLLILMALWQSASFKETQLQHSRVKAAYEEKEETVKSYFTQKGIGWDGFHLFIRAFKKEKTVEVWIKQKGSDQYSLLHTYPFCSSSGTLGPKRKEGDLQIPEGVYHLNHFNPQSNFHLSLGINYPNASDKILSDAKQPGSAIYIHGNCVTIGCIPITDDKIKELYILAVEARNNNQTTIPIHVFPSKLDEAEMQWLSRTYSEKAQLIHFWRNLKIVFDDFENSRTLRRVRVNSQGEYSL